MKLSFNNYLFAILAFSSSLLVAPVSALDTTAATTVASARSNSDVGALLARMEELEATVKELKALSSSSSKNNVRGANNMEPRALVQLLDDSLSWDEGEGKKDRNICYSGDKNRFSAFVECDSSNPDDENASDEYGNFCEWEISASVEEDDIPTRRVLITEENGRELVQSVKKGRELAECLEESASSIDTYQYEDTPFGLYGLGPVKMKGKESLMLELTTTTMTLLEEEYKLFAKKFETDTYNHAGIYVKAMMWPNCNSIQSCLDKKPIYPEPERWIPLHVVSSEEGVSKTKAQGREEMYQYDEQKLTSTSKLFFPASIVQNGYHFVALEFSLYARSAAVECNRGWQYLFAEASLDSFILDAQVIKNADFGNCGWEVEGDGSSCGLFDKGCK